MSPTSTHSVERTQLDINIPMWLHASGTSEKVVVYVSEAMKQTDRGFAPVAEFLAQHQMTETERSGSITDTSMFFGSAREVFYAGLLDIKQ